MDDLSVGRVEQIALPRAGVMRTVRIYTPPGYPTDQPEYPVVYMFDGQNIFDDASATRGMGWHVDSTIDTLTLANPAHATVVVGIDSPHEGADRVAELSLGDWEFPTAKVMPELGPVVPINGSGDITTDFLIHTVKPHIERHFWVATDRQRVAVAGSSLGGFMALHAMALHPDQFGVVLAFSPAVFDEPMRGDHLRQLISQSRYPGSTEVYLDMGGAENLAYYGDVVSSLGPLADAVKMSGHGQPTTVVFPGHSHDERSWEQRFPAALLWGLHGGPTPCAGSADSNRQH
jgi:predicted alpha/beta superfamily hydrolase